MAANPQTAPESTPPPPGYGPRILLMGDSGTGKTESLKTLVSAGITPLCIATESNFIQQMRGLLGSTVHYIYIDPMPGHNFDQIIDMAKKINILSYENLCKVTDPFKMQHNKFIDVLSACNVFVCDCCKKNWGAAINWNTDRALVIDSLSGWSDMAFALVVGNKPVRALPDYQIAQNAIRMALSTMISKLKCTFVLVSHIDREKNEITGVQTITARTVGQKLGPDLPRQFSDVIRARRVPFVWDTADTDAVVVGRHLATSSNLDPSFKPLIEAWKKNGGKIEATV